MKTHIKNQIVSSLNTNLALSHPLTPRESEVAALRCLPELRGDDPITYSEAGRRMKVSATRVRNIEGQVYRKLARAARATRSGKQARPADVIDAEGYEVSAAE